MWIARDKSGNLRWFETKPGRDWGNYDDYLHNELTVWKDEVIENNEHILPNYLFPELTWEDTPVEVELIPKERVIELEECEQTVKVLQKLYRVSDKTVDLHTLKSSYPSKLVDEYFNELV